METEMPDIYLLNPTNFTPLTRTPWAGKKITEKIKWAFVQKVIPVGESWEFSCDPDFDSKLLEEPSKSLMDLIRNDPEGMLSAAQLSRTGPFCQVLVKLLNPALPLSLQVHPADDDPHLCEAECGKPESWLVLDAEPGAVLYLGFKQAISKDELAAKIEAGEDLAEILQAVEVTKGDFFHIEPGVVHAIGPGVTLLEPQRILAGRSGKTFRLWDWGRRYDEGGHLVSHGGQGRALHVEEALKIVEPKDQVGAAFVRALKQEPQVIDRGPIQVFHYPQNAHYQVIKAVYQQACTLKIKVVDGYVMLLPVKEGFTYAASAMRKRVPQGQPCFVPAALASGDLQGDAGLELMIIIPSGAVFSSDDAENGF